jgi:hypothetical protein
MTDNHDVVRNMLDAVSLVTVIGAMTDMFPAVAALFTIIWTSIRIYETDTVQKFLGRD